MKEGDMVRHGRDRFRTCDGARFSPRLVFGFAVMAVGLLLTLDYVGVVEARDYWRYWPVILIATGVAAMTQSLRERGQPAGMSLMAFGTFVLLANVGILDFKLAWAIGLLGLGATIVWKALVRPRSERAQPAGPIGESLGSSIEPGGRSSSLSAFAVMGGVQKGTSAPDFQRGDAFAFMGGCEIDLRGASIQDGEAVFDTFAFWGGVEIRVPEDWAVENRGLALLGGFVDTTRRPSDAKKRLVLTGIAIMGGVEVKN